MLSFFCVIVRFGYSNADYGPSHVKLNFIAMVTYNLNLVHMRNRYQCLHIRVSIGDCVSMLIARCNGKLSGIAWDTMDLGAYSRYMYLSHELNLPLSTVRHKGTKIWESTTDALLQGPYTHTTKGYREIPSFLAILSTHQQKSGVICLFQLYLWRLAALYPLPISILDIGTAMVIC